MKTYVLTVSERFPKTHNRAGELTYFPTKIKNREKIHTIRANFDLWEKRFEEINQGNACLSVRVWDGKPYRSKQIEIFHFTKADGIGIQSLDNSSFVNAPVDGKKVNWEDVATNDGLSFDDFQNWFKGYDKSKQMVIIHFTEFRY